MKKVYWIMFSMLGLLSACNYDYSPVPPGVTPPKATATLEAKYVSTAPNKVSSAYWSKADFHAVTAQNLSIGNLYNNGLLNMTGTYNGLSSFSGGANPNITMKAAYDDSALYVLLEWTDATFSISNSTWLHNGPLDPLKGDSSRGWTSQRNNDKVALAFEIDAASSSAGTFSNVGCAASCHNNQMQPQAGKVDIWNWNLGLAEPFGYAGDMIADGNTGLAYDAGQKSFVRNNIGSTDTSGPAFEWDGTVQNVTRASGTASILDPAYYLLNKTPFTGDLAAGEAAYNNITYGCVHCHGENGIGNGESGDGPAFTRPAMNRYSRQTFKDHAAALTHDGNAYYSSMSPTEVENVISYIRGLSGVPGYCLQQPDGSNADIISASNTNLVSINSTTGHTQYKVLLKRKLNTGNPDDAVFNLTQSTEYVFGVALMDNDGKNHIGSLKETLKFLNK